MDGFLLSIRQDGIVISCETRLSLRNRSNQARGLTHEEYGSFESSVSRRSDLTKYLSVGDPLFDSDLGTASERADKV